MAASRKPSVSGHISNCIFYDVLYHILEYCRVITEIPVHLALLNLTAVFYIHILWLSSNADSGETSSLRLLSFFKFFFSGLHVLHYVSNFLTLYNTKKGNSKVVKATN